ncbi:hypothetical protein B0T22DRAFT_442096 [Podospora appendiculata]|uniref:Uncharacterized protein n=1 Tax=Podospora appendiculata TaxID=314037 RepID=A0AAE1C9W3_9PEZI|nr:hypothetical protein B0T22DRAFT_442096 [Podospora appendiculata]
MASPARPSLGLLPDSHPDRIVDKKCDHRLHFSSNLSSKDPSSDRFASGKSVRAIVNWLESTKARRKSLRTPKNEDAASTRSASSSWKTQGDGHDTLCNGKRHAPAPTSTSSPVISSQPTANSVADRLPPILGYEEEYSLTFLNYKAYFNNRPLGRCLDDHDRIEEERKKKKEKEGDNNNTTTGHSAVTHMTETSSCSLPSSASTPNPMQKLDILLDELEALSLRKPRDDSTTPENEEQQQDRRNSEEVDAFWRDVRAQLWIDDDEIYWGQTPQATPQAQAQAQAEAEAEDPEPIPDRLSEAIALDLESDPDALAAVEIDHQIALKPFVLLPAPKRTPPPPPPPPPTPMPQRDDGDILTPLLPQYPRKQELVENMSGSLPGPASNSMDVTSEHISASEAPMPAPGLWGVPSLKDGARSPPSKIRAPRHQTSASDIASLEDLNSPPAYDAPSRRLRPLTSPAEVSLPHQYRSPNPDIGDPHSQPSEISVKDTHSSPDPKVRVVRPRPSAVAAASDLENMHHSYKAAEPWDRHDQQKRKAGQRGVEQTQPKHHIRETEGKQQQSTRSQQRVQHPPTKQHASDTTREQKLPQFRHDSQKTPSMRQNTDYKGTVNDENHRLTVWPSILPADNMSMSVSPLPKLGKKQPQINPVLGSLTIVKTGTPRDKPKISLSSDSDLASQGIKPGFALHRRMTTEEQISEIDQILRPLDSNVESLGEPTRDSKGSMRKQLNALLRAATADAVNGIRAHQPLPSFAEPYPQAC